MAEDTKAAPGEPVVVKELPIKSYWESATVRNIAYALGATLIGQLVDHSKEVQEFILMIMPDSIDAMALWIFSWLLTVLAPIFGIRAVKARADVGDISGLYRKKPA